MAPLKTYRRSPRLKGFDYMGPLTAHLVLVTRLRKPIFRADEGDEAARVALAALDETCVRFGATSHAYCLMPDHLHLLVSVPESTSLQEFVRSFKQISGFRLKGSSGEGAWQVSYYDRVLRNEEATEDIARYIWSNPVTAGLVENPFDYPLSGPREVMADVR